MGKKNKRSKIHFDEYGEFRSSNHTSRGKKKKKGRMNFEDHHGEFSLGEMDDAWLVQEDDDSFFRER